MPKANRLKSNTNQVGALVSLAIKLSHWSNPGLNKSIEPAVTRLTNRESTVTAPTKINRTPKNFPTTFIKKVSILPMDLKNPCAPFLAWFP